MIKRIFWAGDSTVKDNFIDTYPRTGIAQGLRWYLKPDVTIINHAENAKSTKNFIKEGRLETIRLEIRDRDFFFIEFGHNDWNDDPMRHTLPFEDYKSNLSQMVNVALEKGAYPVLITPLYCRFLDENGVLKHKVHFNYPDAMIELSQEMQIPCIDLCEHSRQLLLHTDLSISKNWYMNLKPGQYAAYPDGLADNAHLQYNGAIAFADILAKGLKGLGLIYADLVL